jgi:heme-degrading monooxygenase HmoA
MIHEIAEIEIIDGLQAEFEAAVNEATPHFQAAQGCSGMKLLRSIEHPARYRLVVTWATLEDHTVTFRGSEGFAAWRALAGPFFAASPRVEHVETVLLAF